VLRIPVHSANTLVLLRLLRERIVPSQDDGGPRAGDGLGRILFERKPGRSLVAAVWLLPLIAVIALAVTFYFGVIGGDRAALWHGLELAGLMALIWLLPVAQYAEFRVYERGVLRKSLLGRQQLKFSDVDTFTYAAVRQYVKGVYSGTNFALTFASAADGKLRKLKYARTLRNADAELDHLRDSISHMIADRMAAHFQAGKPVTWTDGLRFLPEGLEYRAAGFLGRKAPVVIPHSQISGYDLHQGMFWLWVHGRKKPVVKESTVLPNFFPGYFFLLSLRNSYHLMAANAAAQAAESAASL